MTSENPSIIQRLRTGAGAQGARQAATIVIRLAEVPLFLAFWGASRYGEWLIVAAIPAYLAMADGGFTGATQREMTMRVGAGDREGALAAFQSTWALLWILSAALLALAALSGALPLVHWFGITTMSSGAFSAVVVLLTAHIVIGFQCGLIYGGYSCEGRYGRGTYLTTALYGLDFVGLAIALLLGGGPVAAAAGMLLGRLVGLAIFVRDLRKVAPWIKYGFAKASSAQIMALVRPSLASMAFPLGQAFNIQGMRLVVGLLLGPQAVAVFSTIRTLCRSAVMPTHSVAHLIQPELALSYGGGKPEGVRELLGRSSQATLWLALPTAAILGGAGHFVLNVWTGGHIALDVPLFTFLLLASVAHAVWYTALMVPYATNRHGQAAIIFLIANAALLGVAAILLGLMGLAGAGVALVAFEFVTGAWVLRHALTLSGGSFGAWAQMLVRPPIYLLRGLVSMRSAS